MGDHTEILQIDFLPNIISLEELLKLFWRNHNSNRGAYKGRQYISLLLYHSDEQKQTIFQVKEKLEEEWGEAFGTEIAPYHGFHRAEDYHQKYYLKRYPDAVVNLLELYGDEGSFVNSTLAAWLNGFVKGYGSLSTIKEEIQQWEMDEARKNKFLQTIDKIRW